MTDSEVRLELTRRFNQKQEHKRGFQDAKEGKPANIRSENTLYLEGWVDGMFGKDKK